MNKHANFTKYLEAMRELPEVRALLNYGGGRAGPLLALRASEAIAEAFDLWYEARTFHYLGERLSPGANAYPGDRSAFNVALKAAFFNIRYAFPKMLVDRSLEAIARSLPDAAELDSYADLQQFVKKMEHRNKVTERLNPRLTDEVGRSASKNCNCPACQARKALEQLIPENDMDRLLADTKEEGSSPKAVSEKFGPQFTQQLAEQLDELTKQVRAQRPQKPANPMLNEYVPADAVRTFLVSQATAIREEIKHGRLDEFISANLDLDPNDTARLGDFQATLAVSTELGFGDIVQPLLAAINRRWPGLNLTAEPPVGTAEFDAYQTLKKEILDHIGQAS